MALSQTELLLGLLVLILAAVVVWLLLRRRRTTQLKTRFGSEYERTVDDIGDEGKAADVLAKREKRVASYHIKPLSPEKREPFIERWRRIQSDFVDGPSSAVTDADDLLGEVMSERGYPVRDFDQMAEDLSVDHPEVVENYRTAHDIAERHARGDASTEDLRKAMIHYRALFDDLVNEPRPEAGEATIKRKEKKRE
jgi:hypothetical protein